MTGADPRIWFKGSQVKCKPWAYIWSPGALSQWGPKTVPAGAVVSRGKASEA